MTVRTGRGTLVVAGTVGLGALGLVVLALLPPAPPQPTSVPSASASAPAVAPPSASAPPTASAEPSPTATSPRVLAEEALTSYRERLSEGGGVDLALIDASGQPVTLSLTPSGNYRASTTDPLGPEWVLVDGVLYGRLGTAERERHQETFAALGKPDAAWTSAAVSAEAQRRLLATADIAAVIGEALPLMDDLSVEDSTGLTITGTVPADRSAALLAAYAFEPAPQASPAASASPSPSMTPAVTQSTGPRPVTITLLLDPTGTLRGYRASLPGAASVESTVRQFATASVTAPDPATVITLEDLDRAAALASQSASASASPSPTPSAAATEKPKQKPKPARSGSASPSAGR